MRVLQVGKYYQPEVGGIERHVGILARGLHARDVNVEVVVHHRVRHTVRESVEGVPVTRVGTLAEPEEQVAQYVSATVDPVDFAHVLDMDFRGAGVEGLLFEAGELVAALADIAADGDDFAAVVFLEPRNDDRGIESAGVGEGNFLRFVHIDFAFAY